MPDATVLPLRRTRAALVLAVVIALPAALAVAATPDRAFAPAGSEPGQLRPHASGLAVSANGAIVTGNTADDEIEVFAHDGTWLRRTAVPGLRAVAVDGEEVLVADAEGVRQLGGALRVVATGVTALAVAGDVILTARPDGIYAGDERFADVSGANGIAVAPGGDVYVSTPTRVHRFSADGAAGADWPAKDVRGIAAAPNGEVLLAQGTLHRVGVFSPEGELRDTHTGMNHVNAVAADCRGTVFALDNSDPRGHVFPVAGAAPPPCLAPPPPPPPSPPPPEPEPQVAVLGEVVEAGPELGRTQRATVREGQVYVGRGKARRALTRRTLLPVGTAIDATEGTVKLEFEPRPGADRDRYGRYMEGEFSDGEFSSHQGTADSIVELHLEGSGVGTSPAQAAATRKKRRVWSTARGKFRTVGRHGAATVRGTRWYIEDRSDGTYFKVSDGSVSVRDFRTGDTRVLHAGESFLARATCVSRRRFWIELQIPVGTRVSRAEVRLGGKRLPIRLNRRALVDLRGRRKGRVSVRILVRLSDGTTLAGTRVYSTCERKRARGDGPPL